jgi:uncharacterized membrane protein
MTPKNRQKPYILTAMLIALCVVIGYVFLYVPNVELLTASVFVSGYLVGPLLGVTTGLFAELIFSLFNPMGAPIPSLLVAQTLSMALIGGAGGLYRKRASDEKMSWSVVAQLALVGFVLTLLFDVLTTLSFAILMAGTDVKKLLSTFVYGMSFYAIHLFWNTVVFAVLVPMLISRLRSHVVS